MKLVQRTNPINKILTIGSFRHVCLPDGCPFSVFPVVFEKSAGNNMNRISAANQITLPVCSINHVVVQNTLNAGICADYRATFALTNNNAVEDSHRPGALHQFQGQWKALSYY